MARPVTNIKAPWTPAAGDMRHKASITVKSATLANKFEDSGAAPDPLGPFHCCARTRAMGESDDGAGAITRVRYDVYFRYQPELAAITTDAVIEFTDGAMQGNKLNVTAIDPLDGRRQWLKFVAEARNQEG